MRIEKLIKNKLFMYLLILSAFFMILGSALNIVCVRANGGKMPVDQKILTFFPDQNKNKEVFETSTHTISNNDTKLPALIDKYIFLHIENNKLKLYILSIGDIFLLFISPLIALFLIPIMLYTLIVELAVFMKHLIKRRARAWKV